MGKVIGYKDSPGLRRINWLSMLNYRGSYLKLKDLPGTYERTIANRDKSMYNIHMSNYTRDVA